MIGQINDIALEELIKRSEDIISKGGTVYTKFTCLHCGSRQTFETPNAVYMQGICEECGKTSELTKYGMMVVFERETRL